MKRRCALLVTPLVMIVAGIALLPSFSLGDATKDRKNASGRIAGEISHIQLHKVYVSDFLDDSGMRGERGCYFSSVFSTFLKDQAKNFEILNRIETQKFLTTAGISASDLQKSESLAKLIAATGADAILFGTLTLKKGHAILALSLRETTKGRELYQTQYEERLTPFVEASFPATTSPDGQFFYFAGFDGISIPKCRSCPQPNYSDAARAARISGTVLLSAIFAEDGRLKDIRLVRSLDPALDAASVAAMQKWSVDPAKDPAGHPVPVRVPVETTFHLYF